MKNLITTALLLIVLSLAASFCMAEIPDQILKIIKNRAASEYPTNYSMQSYTTERQKKAYRFLTLYNPTQIPPKIFVQMKQRASNEYTTNFAMQKYTLRREVEKYEDMQMGL